MIQKHVNSLKEVYFIKDESQICQAIHFITSFALSNPGSRIGIFSGTFRQSKSVFNELIKFIEHGDGGLLKQSITGAISCGVDAWKVGISNSEIIAAPISLNDKFLDYNLIVVAGSELIPSKVIDSIVSSFVSINNRS